MNAAVQSIPIAISRPRPGFPVFAATSATTIAVRAGATLSGVNFADATPVELPELVAGTDYRIDLVDGRFVARSCAGAVPVDAIGGFHFAPGGNAIRRDGGDETPAINPLSIWDAGFRPACLDPRGMALVEAAGPPFWCDIYLLNTDHMAKGTSRFGETIADGYDRPSSPEGGKVKALDYPTAVAIYAHHGKSLLTYDEFREAAIGVTERTAAKREPKTTGLDAARTSRAGIMQATGNMWVWGTDGDPYGGRPSVFGGSRLSGGDSGSRYAYLGHWPDYSDDNLSARGRCDHAA